MKAFGLYRVNTTSTHNKTNKKTNTFHIQDVAITIQARGESCPLLKPWPLIYKNIYIQKLATCIFYVLILN